jgi:hypothetical protein
MNAHFGLGIISVSQGLNMLKSTRDIELLRHNDNHLMIQYKELLYLRAQLGGLLFPIKRSPPRKRRISRSNRSVARGAKRNERPMSRAPILLLIRDR